MYGLVEDVFEVLAETMQHSHDSPSGSPGSPSASGLPRRDVIRCPPARPAGQDAKAQDEHVSATAEGGARDPSAAAADEMRTERGEGAAQPDTAHGELREAYQQVAALKTAIALKDSEMLRLQMELDVKSQAMGPASNENEAQSLRASLAEARSEIKALRDGRKGPPPTLDGVHSAGRTCLRICERILGRMKEEDPFAVNSPAPPVTGFRTRSTVGMMLNGCVVEFLVVGGPAYNSGQLDRGDTVLKVNDETVTRESILQALVGEDAPGSELSLTVKKGGKAGVVRVVLLQRMATERIADRRRAFELFTIIKDRASHLEDDKIPLTVDKCISLWTNMLVQDTYYHDKASKRFKILREQCITWLEEMHAELSKSAVSSGDKADGSNAPASTRVPAQVVMSAGEVNKNLASMHADLLESVEIVRKCIDDYMSEKAVSLSTESSRAESSTPLSLKERVTRDAVRRGVIHAERSQDQKKLARLEYDVDTLKIEVEKWKQHAAAAAEKATQRSAAAELWREKAENSYREKCVAEEQWKREREAGVATSSQRDVVKRELEEAWKKERSEMQDRLIVVHEQLRTTEEKLHGHEARALDVGRQLDDHHHQVEVLKTELQKRTLAFSMRIGKLEQEQKDVEVHSRQTASQEDLDASLAAAQSYLQNMSRMQEESSTLQLAAQHLHQQFVTLLRNEGKLESENNDNRFSADMVSSYEYFSGVAESLCDLQNELVSVRSLRSASSRYKVQVEKAAKDAQELENALREVGIAGRSDLPSWSGKMKIVQELQDQVKRLEEALRLKAKEEEAALEREQASKQQNDKALEVVLEREQASKQENARALEVDHEIAQLKGVNDLLVSDMSLMEKEANALKDELGKTRAANARLSTITQDLERETAIFRAKGWPLSSRSPRDTGRRPFGGRGGSSQGNTDRSVSRDWEPMEEGALVRESAAGRSHTQHRLDAALVKIKQQDEEIKELQGYCTALLRSPSKAKAPGSVGTLGIA